MARPAVHRTQEQVWDFNYPYQASSKTFAKTGDEVDDVTIMVQEGDIIIAATDGVLDNLYDQGVQTLVADILPHLCSPDPAVAQMAIDMLAEDIAKQAAAIGSGKYGELDTPWMAAANAAGRSASGGKLDDVALVCGVVRCGERPPARVGHNFGNFVGAQSDEQPMAPKRPPPFAHSRRPAPSLRE